MEKNYGIKVLIIDTSFNKTIHELFGLKLIYDEIIKYKRTNLWIVSLTNINKLEYFLKYKNKYDLILIDTCNDCEIKDISEKSEIIISLVEPNLIGISKFKRQYWSIRKDKTNSFVFFNMLSNSSFDKNILRIVFSNFSYLGMQKKNINLEKYINKQKIYERCLDKRDYRIYSIISNKLFKIKKNKKYIINISGFKDLLKKIFTKEDRIYGIRSGIR